MQKPLFQRPPHRPFASPSPYAALWAGAVALTVFAAAGFALTACGAGPSSSDLTSVSSDTGVGTDTSASPTPTASSGNSVTNSTATLATTPDQGFALVWDRDQTQCLAASGNVIAANSPVVQVPCDGSSLQQWSWVNGQMRMGSWCMTSSAFKKPITLTACTAGNANQNVTHSYGKIINNTLGYPLPVLQSDNSTHLMSAAADTTGTEPSNQRVYLLTSVPSTRGFVVRNAADTNACLALTAMGVQTLPCVTSDTNQRWDFGLGFLRNLAGNLCVAHNGLAGPVTAIDCANMNQLINGLTFGAGGTLAGHVQASANTYPGLTWDPNAQNPNAVTYAVTTLPGRLWHVGKPDPY